MKILLIEDDRETAETLIDTLRAKFVVELASSGKEGEYMAQVNEYGVIVLDYALPDIDGNSLCKSLREDSITVPILMLTGNSEVKNKVKAFTSGVDDYVVKPVDESELIVRIEALLRRSCIKVYSSELVIDDLTLDIHKRQAFRNNKQIHLKRKELDLLEYLMRNAGQVVTRTMIFDHIWESSFESDTNVVDVHIKYLRDQIDRNFEKKLIKTVHGYGYKLDV